MKDAGHYCHRIEQVLLGHLLGQTARVHHVTEYIGPDGPRVQCEVEFRSVSKIRFARIII